LPNPTTNPLSIGDIGNALHATFVGFLCDDIADLRVTLPDRPLAGWLTERAPYQRSLTLSRDGGYLTAPADSQIIAAVPNLRWVLPFDLSAFPFRLGLLPNGWRIDRINCYRLLVYYVVCGGVAIMQQFSLSLRSLVIAGDYTGDIAVLTDKPTEEIHALLPRDLPTI